MKKLLGVLLVLVYSCTTTNDGTTTTTTTTTVVPVPPENLTGEVISATAVNLMWTDRSTNEKGFKIERKLTGGNFEVIGTTATSITTFSDKELTPGGTYIYKVYSYNEAGNSPTYSNELTLTTKILSPTVTTTTAISITALSAVIGGMINSDGGGSITARGVVWSTSPKPTIALITKSNQGTGIGTFTSTIRLSENTTYYIRAYATNSQGEAYGNEVSFTTLKLPILTTIGTQTWATKNLDVATYSDGTPIPQFDYNDFSWGNLTTGAWCYFNNDATYGKLYNWYAVAGIWNEQSKWDASARKKLAPTGFHIPSDVEWTTLTTYLGGESVAGGKMKETSTAHWGISNTGATNSSGFTAIPGQHISGNSDYMNTIGDGNWWSSSQYPDARNSSFSRFLMGYSSNVYSNYNNKTFGFSVRCIRD